MKYDGFDDEYEGLIDEEPSNQEQQEETIEQPQETFEDETPTEENEIDLFATLLKDRGIEDKSKISFEDENGNVQEVNWDDLSTEEQLNILRTSTPEAETGLDEAEIQWINAIRNSNLTPNEYIQAIQNQAIEQYKNFLQPESNYTVDQYSDDDLYRLDLINRMGLTQEEADESLERAKTNETLYNKQVAALRNEYKKQEDEYNQYTKLQQEQAQEQQYNQFKDSIETEINSFKLQADGNLEMSMEDKQNLYEFITGFDQAGNSWFGKALQDPNTVVKMAWFALNGEQMIQDIQDFYNSEIIKIKNSYNQKKTTPNNVIYKPKSTNTRTDVFDDLDDDF